MNEKNKIDFGYQQVNTEEKASLVRQVFDSVANRYDLMNDLMSLGIHRYWKKFTIDQAGITAGNKILDLAGGTGDLTKRLSELTGKQGLVVLADINHNMLSVGRNRLLNKGIISNVEFVQTNAEHLAFPDNFFNCITIAFGLRNVTNKISALESMYRVLKPGGQLLILEFSTPTTAIVKRLYDTYSFSVLPRLGQCITKDADSYRYLVESIRMHPNQETLKGMLETAGFEQASYQNLSGGIVALHRGMKR